MKRSGGNHEQTKAVQKVQPAQPPATSDNSRAKLRQRLCSEVEKITGTGREVAHVLVAQLACGLATPDWRDKDGCLIRACSILAEYKPVNIVEAQLVAQMVATHECAMRAIERAMDRQQSSEGIDMNIKRAARMMKLHLEQIEAWQKLKGKAGQQKVTVEHVHVHEGGHAIVGAVNAPGGGGGAE